MTRNLALDIKPIRVNLVSPGAVDTELWDQLSREEREKLFASMEKGTLTGRVGAVEDVVEQFLALIRDKNVTGSIVRSDGGHLLI
jgi:NAD(P)-dependent dehydrogenase (short-subunit alcohol dehydrogenase family)